LCKNTKVISYLYVIFYHQEHKGFAQSSQSIFDAFYFEPTVKNPNSFKPHLHWFLDATLSGLEWILFNITGLYPLLLYFVFSGVI
jgi:hypothetical protein